ncbi:methyltransferase domain-containing protein [Thermococcus sp. 18S1]|uniref:class I SAM-dependent methyltransferase n=1 Tax=Thermococcus sp. 18S1 TaxID=1638210 RepID=UPI0014392EA3|nr:methyltransferase domain-containing protein [Thermococcus sp. 18S1]NJE29464.1 methyltransferase domain-containing protein [Thermococcus sp. 18S1]
MDPLVEVLDRNMEAMADVAVGYLIQIGLKYDIFKELVLGVSREKLIASVPLPNKERLGRLIDTYLQLGIAEESGGSLRIAEFSYELPLARERLEKLLPDWIPILEEMYKMVDYAFISREHPKVLMDFDKGADFWDMRLLLGINRVYRQLASRLLGLEDGMRIIDLGCGSVSPVELGSAVGPNGKYVGIDFSPGLLSIATTRVRNEGLDWVTLREMDVRRLVVRNTYDGVVMSFLLGYLENPGAVVRKAIEMLSPGARLVILDSFRDLTPKVAALEFFESLTKEFVRFPSAGEILAAVDESPYDVEASVIGNSTIVVTRVL